MAKVQLEIIGWSKGLQSVALIKAVKRDCTGSLAAAKARVDNVLDCIPVLLEFEDDATRAKFRDEATALGAICR